MSIYLSIMMTCRKWWVPSSGIQTTKTKEESIGWIETRWRWKKSLEALDSKNFMPLTFPARKARLKIDDQLRLLEYWIWRKKFIFKNWWFDLKLVWSKISLRDFCIICPVKKQSSANKMRKNVFFKTIKFGKKKSSFW